MKTNLLRILRMSAAAAVLALMAVLFADWGGDTSMGALRGAAAPLARWQVVPAVMAVSVGTLAALLLLTLLFGRLYCSVLCPLGVMQDGVNVAAKLSSKRAATRFSYRRPRRWMRYGVLALTAVLIAAGVGGAVALLDPYSIFGRIIYDGLRPLVQGCNNFLALVAGDDFAAPGHHRVVAECRSGRCDARRDGHLGMARRTVVLQLVLPRRDAAGRGVARIAVACAYRRRPLCLVWPVRAQVQGLVYRCRIAQGRSHALRRLLRLHRCVSPRSHIVWPGRGGEKNAAAVKPAKGVTKEGAVDESRKRFLTTVAAAAAAVPAAKAQSLQNSFATVAKGEASLRAAPSRGSGRGGEPRPPARQVHVVPPVREQVPGPCAAACRHGVRSGGYHAPRDAFRQGLLPI